MTERLGLPVFVDNDANLGALAELMWGAARGVVDGAYIRVGTGIGAGLIIGGSVYRGARGTAGEIGHSTIAPDGPVCRCGNRGCLERVAGGRAILQSLAGSHAHELTLDEVLDHALHGEAACRRIISDAGHLVGAQVATLCNLVNPERVVIGGPLSTAGDILLDPLRHTIARSALPIAADTAEVVLGELGDRAAALGAVALVLQTVDPFHDGTEGGGWGGPGTRVREEGLEAIATS
jgi:predicted NBD/HSP70 family sugar kinase